LIAWAALPPGDHRREEQPQLPDFRPVLANREVLALTVGYAAAIWGCVGLRQWIVVFLTFFAGNQRAYGRLLSKQRFCIGAFHVFFAAPQRQSVSRLCLQQSILL